ncbi:MAG: hypothetical protein KY444_05775, partial [Gemmatimonadetes bacterium]|nr:hypothetical protein [Gemmatimonadota bacterium]
DAGRTGYAGEARAAREMGLDAKMGLGSAGTLDVTVNTDFAQVEADDPQVNLTRYGVLYPERRPFFLERADLFALPTHRGTGLFYSRRIGLSDAGTPVPITAGARLAARAAGWDVGALGVRTGGQGGAPGEWFGVGRARRQVVNRHSAVGMMGTLRAGADGGPAAALAGDARLRVRGDDYLTLVWAQAWNDSTAVSVDAARAVASFERRAPRGVNGEVYAVRTGAGYDPALGFVRARGTTEVGGRLAHRWVRGGTGPLRAHSLGLVAGREARHADGGWESGSLGLQWEAQTRRGALLVVGASTQRQDLVSPFALPRGVSVPAGVHRYPVLTADYEPAYRARLRVGGGAETGGFYDGTRTTLSTRTTWNASRHLEVRGNYSFNRVRFATRDQGFDAHTALVRTTVALDTRLSAIGTLQWNSAARQAGGQLRVRYNLREGHDVYVVYGEGWNTERAGLTPVPPVTSTRRLMIKYTRNLTLGG